MPHNNCLVVELQVGDVEVSRIRINSSVNVIFKETLKNMDFPDSEIKPYMESLTGFTEDKTMTVGTVNVPIYVGGSARMIKFLVLNKLEIDNTILGTQTISRQCHLTECKLSLARTCIIGPCQKDSFSVVSEFAQPKQSLVEQVGIDPTNPERCVGIDAELDKDIWEALVNFFRKNVATFAWSIDGMPGISPEITCHELNVDSTYKPIKQKKRKLEPEKTRAVNDEIKKLLKAGSIMEVRYLDWLANLLVVKKKNRKWRICVDFTDLKKAFPKYSFPLPHIDPLVEATAGNELLSFMDAFLGIQSDTDALR
ncbi:uncharacterized protein LOC112089148 [Eutrema salsugineum]|uniref:uncharacterized protein LOC112089148 n=1 Tax=Eutrema salsugineum TaxID=72664 RepID=UPI000CECFFBC|nr:uncharacterized protein LOC112089148 [Eutrema salsugineum]